MMLHLEVSVRGAAEKHPMQYISLMGDSASAHLLITRPVTYMSPPLGVMGSYTFQMEVINPFSRELNAHACAHISTHKVTETHTPQIWHTISGALATKYFLDLRMLGPRLRENQRYRSYIFIFFPCLLFKSVLINYLGF